MVKSILASATFSWKRSRVTVTGFTIGAGMDEPTERMTVVANRIGSGIADLVFDRVWRRDRAGPGGTAETVLRMIGEQIDEEDLEFEPFGYYRDLDFEVAGYNVDHVAGFLKILDSNSENDKLYLPLLRVVGGTLVPVDTFNPRADRAIEVRRQASGYGLTDAQVEPLLSPDNAERLRGFEPIRFLELQPKRQVASRFFSLFTLSFWGARKSARQNGLATVCYTVDSSSSGYQLEYWPQFFFSPTVFGSCKTRPVTATIPVNYYYFQGWKNGQVYPDGGVHIADAVNSSTMLRAF